MKVFITRAIFESGLQKLREAGIEYTQWTEKRDLTQQELIEHAKAHDALLFLGANKLDKDFLNACSHLKVISLHSVGYDKVDIEEAARLNIPVGNTPGVLSKATADTAFLLMLATSRKAFYMHKTIEKGEWGFSDPMANLGKELYGKTLGVFGLGKIGFEMARLCKSAYGMDIIYYNRSNNPEAEQELNARKVSFDELLANSDVLTVHTALTDETRGMFNKEVFNKMKPDAIFINTARGAIHNEDDLAEALEKGIIWGAGLDVTNPEPMKPGNPLLNMPNVCILPHIGSATLETRREMTRLAVENVIAGLKGEPLPNRVLP
jgi:glyoxylate reductase